MTHPEYTITTDSHNFVLNRICRNKEGEITLKDGEPSYKAWGYYSSVASLLKASVDKAILVHGLDRLAEARKSLEEIVKVVKELPTK